MTTPVWITGFEHGVLSANGGGVCNTLTGTDITVQSSIKRTGGYALRCNNGGTNQARIMKTMATPTYIVGSLYFYVATYPSSAEYFVRLTSTASVSFYFYLDAPTHRLGTRISSGTMQYSGTLTTGTWYRLDFRAYCGGSTFTIDWQVDGTDYTQATFSSTATTFTNVDLGCAAAAAAYDCYYDDVIVSTTSGDYPIGAHAVEGLSPTDLTGQGNPGTGVMQDEGAADISDSNQAYLHVNSIPIGDTTTYITQAATGTSNYAGVNFADTSNTDIIGGMALLAYRAASASPSDEGGAIIVDEDTTQTTVWGNPTTRADYSESSVFYKSVVLPAPAGGWDQAAVNALTARMGYSNDVAPVPWWVDLLIEVAYLPVSTTTVPLTAATLTASGQTVSIVPGEVSATLLAAALSALGQAAPVVPGGVTMAVSAAALSASGQAITAVGGAVSVVVLAAAASAVGQAITAITDVTVVLSAAALSAAGQTVTASAPGGGISDNFNRANENPLNTPSFSVWADGNTAGLSRMQLLSNAVQSENTSDAVTWWKTDAFNANQWSECKINGSDGGPAARCSTSGCYYWTPFSDGEVWRFKSPSSWTKIGEINFTVTSSDVVRIQVTGDATDTIIELFKNGVSQGHVHDTSSPLTSGAAGLYTVGSTSLDDWQGGNYLASVDVPVNAASLSAAGQTVTVDNGIAPTTVQVNAAAMTASPPGTGIRHRSISVCNGYTDVTPKQMVRTSDNRLWIATWTFDHWPQGTDTGLGQTLMMYKADQTGTPSSFTRMDSAHEPVDVNSWSIAYDGGSIIHVLWTKRASWSPGHSYSEDGTDNYVYYCQFDTSSGTWGTPETIESSAAIIEMGQGDELVAIAVDAHHVPHIVYLKSDGTRRRVNYRNRSGEAWSDATVVDDQTMSGDQRCWHPGICFDRGGRIAVTWLRGTHNTLNDGRIFIRVYDGSWGMTVDLTGSDVNTGIDQNCGIYIDSSNRYHASWLSAYSSGYVRYKYSDNQGASWTANNPSDTFADNPICAPAPNGRVRIYCHGAATDYPVSYWEGTGGDGAWGSRITYSSDNVPDDCSVNVRWTGYGLFFENRYDIAYWVSNYPTNVLYIGTEVWGADPTYVSLNAATLTASGQVVTAVPGAVSVSVLAAMLVADGQVVTVVPGAVSITLAAAALTASGQSISITIVSGVLVNLLAADLAAQGQAVISVGGPVSSTLTSASLAALGQTLSVVPGAISSTLGSAALISTGQALTVQPGAVAVAISAALLAAGGQVIDIQAGAVSVLLVAATLAITGQVVVPQARTASGIVSLVVLGRIPISASVQAPSMSIVAVVPSATAEGDAG